MLGKLTALGVAKLKAPGMYGDGGGLWLQVSGKGGKSWVFRYTLRGKSREMGLGPVSTFSLAEARDKALTCRKLCYEGIDPIEMRREQRQDAAVESAKAITFRTCADGYIEAHKAGWRNDKHAAQWTATLATYAYPVFGDLPVQAVDTSLVLKALEAIWSTKTETATRVRGRIESVLDWAATRGYRRGENPARWKGHLQNLLPKRSKVRKVEHHAALPFKDVPAFMRTLEGQPGIPAKLMIFTILTAARTGEALGARWDEIDLEAAIWSVPAERMKAGAEHRVPLSTAALAILAEMQGLDDIFVFPGSRRGKPLSNMAMLVLLRRMERAGLTVHGFRSTFRDWASETTHFPSEVVEMALAHTVESKVERAYRRGDLFEKRRDLMDAWATWCSQGAAR
ncbi:integrase arm-type DNA-binding domain-containing protein [Methylobacterium sp. J-030]|uniref:tyrosine-type recombinase/integrase n=1 Tax=Methylobacterium sp. J-030 TaxID=2836627 RepID=UPI001FB946A5|nr:integrase arm-type DNA-binding domain-containing protein [Methylobacterium sp. J-030]MCJ2069170.1 integrase arm-type DNA-binding domain-containing protein [Methylobacterium sp. J-030]